jgi:glycosyltransferase involved in cell wall biosynthesis
MSTVSVALCTRNGARFLEAQLASIAAGTRAPDELVIVDDASHDDTLRIVEDMRARFPASEIRVIRNDSPLGVTANFERAVSHCTGDLVILCDQDDVWAPDRLASVAEMFATDPLLTLTHGNARLVDADGAPLGRTLFEDLGLTEAERAGIAADRAFEVLLRRNVVTGATTAMRRGLVAIAAPFPAEWVHDEWLALVAASTGRVRTQPGIHVDYRQHGSNQIGVAEPTLRYRARRVLEYDPERNKQLASRWAVAARRLAELEAPRERILAVESKARFEAVRARMPRVRIARVPRVVMLAAQGAYRRYASRGGWDVVRDLLQRR